MCLLAWGLVSIIYLLSFLFLTGIFACLYQQNYIQEIRACKTKDAEYERVQKELGKIRKKYTSSKGLSGRLTNILVGDCSILHLIYVCLCSL